jgi:hypothetical protein
VIDPFLCIRVLTHTQVSAFPRDEHFGIAVAKSSAFAQKAKRSLPLPARGAPSRDAPAASVRMRTRTGSARTILFWRSAAQCVHPALSYWKFAR